MESSSRSGFSSLAGARVSPDGRGLSEADWSARVGEWLPSASDREFVASPIGRVVEPGRFAGWIACDRGRSPAGALRVRALRLRTPVI
jgi:hypothetical protein